MKTATVDDRALALAAGRCAPIMPADLVAEGITTTRTSAFRVLAELERQRLLTWNRKGWEITGEPS